MNIATQNGAAIIVRDLDYDSQCCCGLPCVEWSRYARRNSSGFYTDSPPPSFPCCGLLEQYSVSAEWVSRSGQQFRIVGAVTVIADIEFEGAWTGNGGALQVLSSVGWEDWYQQPAIAALTHRGKASGGCEYELSIGGGQTLIDTFRIFVSPRTGPTGEYASGVTVS
jgi:hypothetical protein